MFAVYPNAPLSPENKGGALEFPSNQKMWYAEKQDSGNWDWPDTPRLRSVHRALVFQIESVEGELSRAGVDDPNKLGNGHFINLEYSHLYDFRLLPKSKRRFLIVDAISVQGYDRFFSWLDKSSYSQYVPLCYLILEDENHIRSALNPEVIEWGHAGPVYLVFADGEKMDVTKTSVKGRYCTFPARSYPEK